MPYLVSVFENELVGAFLTGDAASSVIAALIALIQEPASKPPRFGLAAYVSMAGLPIVLCSIMAFIHIERTQAGRYRGESRRLIEGENNHQPSSPTTWNH